MRNGITLTEGQTAMDVYYEPAMGSGAQLQDVTVSNTMISTDLQGRKVLYLQEGATWIEGIGAGWGLFSEPWINLSNYSVKLECMASKTVCVFRKRTSARAYAR